MLPMHADTCGYLVKCTHYAAHACGYLRIPRKKRIYSAAHACEYLWIPRQNAYIMLPMHADTCGYLVKMHTFCRPCMRILVDTTLKCIHFPRKCYHPASQPGQPASPASPASQPSQSNTATQSPAHLQIILDRFARVFSTFLLCFQSVVNSDVLAPPVKHEKTLYFLSISALNS